jgi:phosphatidylethanolamine-binding protein (PEBP) family uncharacterized protein
MKTPGNILVAATVATLLLTAAMGMTLAQAPAAPASPPMVLTTTAWADGTVIPAKYTQAGEQVSPVLNWTNTPAATVSLVLHMYDADAAPTKVPILRFTG